VRTIDYAVKFLPCGKDMQHYFVSHWPSYYDVPLVDFDINYARKFSLSGAKNRARLLKEEGYKQVEIVSVQRQVETPNEQNKL